MFSASTATVFLAWSLPLAACVLLIGLYVLLKAEYRFGRHNRSSEKIR